MRRFAQILFRLLPLWAAVAFLGALLSCKADKVNYDPSLMLEFSTDTIAFDTIFTANGSTTKMFKLYNRAGNRLCISNISLTDGSRYRMNVGGVSAANFTDVYINARDSITVFVQVNIDRNDSNLPLLVEDSIQFLTNGNRQRVILQAYGQEAKRFKRHVVAADTVLTPELPFLISDTLFVRQGATLTVTPGCKLYFCKNAVLKVDGKLVAEGTADAYVEFRGDRSDYMNTVPPLNYDMASAQWDGIRFGKDSKGNRLYYADVRNTTNGISIDSTTVDEQALVMENCILRNSQLNLFTATNANVAIYNSLIYNAGGYIFNLSGGNYELFHNTVANYYSYSWGGRNYPIAVMRNASGDTPLPFNIVAANCIFYGNFNSELTYENSSDAPLNYTYRNCIVKMLVSNVDNNYTDCKVNAAPLFVFQGWDSDYRDANPHLYDFHLQENSPAIGAADVSTSQRFPYDLDGNPRLTGGNSCIGAYEYVPQ